MSLSVAAAAAVLAPALSTDEIIARFTEARGGAEAWKKVQTMAWAGHIEGAAAGVSSVPFLMEFKRPNMMHFEITVQNNKSERIFNGRDGWKVRPVRGGPPDVQAYNAEEVSFARDALGMDGPLVDYRSKGVAVALQGAGEADGQKAYVLRVTLPSGAVRRVWIDADNFMELKYERETRNAAGRTGIVVVHFRDYRQVEGVKLPMIIETGGAAPQQSDKMVIERVALNPPLEDSLFARPLFFKRRSEVTIGGDTRAGGAAPGPD